MEKSAFERIYDIVNQIPEGKVASYGQVAGRAGNRRWARVVGYALHAIPKDSTVPWHRVVKKTEMYLQARKAPGENTRQNCCVMRG